MQLIKRSRKNQVVIPKAILERAGMNSEDAYLKVEYNATLRAIILRPVVIEEKIPGDALERFEAKVVTGQPGDRRFASLDAAVASLRRSRKGRR